MTPGDQSGGVSDKHDAPEVILGKKELAKIQKDIAGTIRPSWHTPPPSNFGTRSHGKLKADQWKSTIEFDLPVSVVQLWYRSDSRRQKLADSTVGLSTALRWGNFRPYIKRALWRIHGSHTRIPYLCHRAVSQKALETKPLRRSSPGRVSSTVWSCPWMVDVSI